MAGKNRDSRRAQKKARDASPLEGNPGQVVAHHGVAVLVRLDSGEEKQVWLTPDQRAVVGDRVTVSGIKLEVLPSHGVLRRRDPRGRERTIAVNLDTLFVVVAIEPRETPGYVDRGFVIARAAGIEPSIIVNKLDLPGGGELADQLEEIYGDSAAILRVSAETGEGLDSIRERLGDRQLAAMVGASGVGKSSLMNALVPDLDLRVSELNRGSRKGRHTTTTATLHALVSGGFLVDTAGFKDFIAVDVTPEEAARFFPGLEGALEAGCRFRDCGHRSEPGCSVLAALEEGRIQSGRHRAYLALLDELAHPSDRRHASGGRHTSDRRHTS